MEIKLAAIREEKKLRDQHLHRLVRDNDAGHERLIRILSERLGPELDTRIPLAVLESRQPPR